MTQRRANTQKSHLVQLRSREIGYASSTIGRRVAPRRLRAPGAWAMANKYSTIYRRRVMPLSQSCENLCSTHSLPVRRKQSGTNVRIAML
jgi:hypothetical protein